MSDHPNPEHRPHADREVIVADRGGAGAGTAIAVILGIIAVVVVLFLLLGDRGADDATIEVPDRVEVDVDDQTTGGGDGATDGGTAETDAGEAGDTAPDAGGEADATEDTTD
jgi:hypothetical protein